MNKRQKTILIIASIIFIFLVICVSYNLTQNIDNSIYKLVKNIQNNTLTKILIIITNLGGILSLFFISLITATILCSLKKSRLGIAVLLNLLMSSITYIILKNIIQRPRPEITGRLVDEVGYSFPSGHTTNNTAFYIFAIYLVCENVKNKKLRNFICILLGMMPIIIGLSRIYLGVHYFSDVIAGFCLGIINTILFISYIYKK